MGAAVACCSRCHHFCNDPQSIERADPGLAALASGYAALRAGDGLCSKHRRYVAVRSSCADFSAPAPRARQAGSAAPG